MFFKAEGVCPQCKQKGDSVNTDTLKIHIKDLSKIENFTYHFCKTPDCHTIYFSVANSFLKDDVNKEIGVKSYSSQNANICYCFNYTKENIKKDSFKEKTKKLKIAGCNCSFRNPQGKCCTADFKKFVKEKFG